MKAAARPSLGDNVRYTKIEFSARWLPTGQPHDEDAN